MKFLTKIPDSQIRVDDLTYQKGVSNSELRLRLLDEQKNFCAYTEKYIEPGIDTSEVEHFNPSLKYNDDYFNYYTTLRSANERKIRKYKEYQNALFFATRFFQNNEDFKTRIRYEDFVYEPITEEDQDAKDLIDYLGFNDDYLFTARINHIKRLQETIGSFSLQEKIEYFTRNKSDLSYITAIEKELDINLSEIIN